MCTYKFHGFFLYLERDGTKAHLIKNKISRLQQGADKNALGALGTSNGHMTIITAIIETKTFLWKN